MLNTINSPNLREKVEYTMENGASTGNIEIIFSDVPHSEVANLVESISVLCFKILNKNNRTNIETTSYKIEKIKSPKLPKEPKKPKEKMPRPAGRISSWEYQFIKKSLDLEDVLRDYWRKYPKTKITKEEVIEVWKYYHTAKWEQQEAEKPAARTEVDPEPGKQIGVGSKVVQVSGMSPANGVGTVMQIKGDGKCKVQFFNHIKVLAIDHFALATLEEINKIKRTV